VWSLFKVYNQNYFERERINMAVKKKLGRYVIVRTYSAGVFAGNLKSRVGKEVTLTNARRLWYWDGAASLSELAVSGTSKPQNCKFPVEVSSIELTEAIEILAVSVIAESSIKSVEIWTAR
jgi:hypothetical protein